MVKLSSGDVDASNIVRPTADQLSAEDRQAYEASSRSVKRRTHGAKRRKSKRSVSGSCLTSPGTERVKSSRTKRWPLFRMKNQLKQIIM